MSLCRVFGYNNYWEVDPYNSDDDDDDGDDDSCLVGVGDESQTFNQSPGPQSLTQLLLLLTYSYSTLNRASKSYSTLTCTCLFILNPYQGFKVLLNSYLYLPTHTQLLPGLQSLTQLLLLLTYSYSTLTRASKSTRYKSQTSKPKVYTRNTQMPNNSIAQWSHRMTA